LQTLCDLYTVLLSLCSLEDKNISLPLREPFGPRARPRGFTFANERDVSPRLETGRHFALIAAGLAADAASFDVGRRAGPCGFLVGLSP